MIASARRPAFRQGLSTLYLPFYDALCSELGPQWQPYIGTRTFNEQDALYAKGRTINPMGPGFIVTNAKGGYSAHNYAAATDWTWFDGETLMWLHKEDPRWQEYIDAVKKVGLRPGSEFGDVDHNELKLSCSWSQVLLVYNQAGMTAAQQHMQANLLTAQPIAQTIP